MLITTLQVKSYYNPPFETISLLGMSMSMCAEKASWNTSILWWYVKQDVHSNATVGHVCAQLVEKFSAWYHGRPVSNPGKV